MTRARILLKADAGEAGGGWSDRQITNGPDTSLAAFARTRQQLVEEGFEAVLIRKHSPASARPRIFDGAAEAKLIALGPVGQAACPIDALANITCEPAVARRRRMLRGGHLAPACDGGGGQPISDAVDSPDMPGLRELNATLGRCTAAPGSESCFPNSSPANKCRA